MTSLMKREPVGLFSNMLDLLEREWYDPFGTDLVKTGEGYTLKVELPGIKTKDLKVHIENGVVSISGKSETDYGIYQLSKQFSIPNSVDPSKCEAKHENGILVLKLPVKESEKGVEIKVK